MILTALTHMDNICITLEVRSNLGHLQILKYTYISVLIQYFHQSSFIKKTLDTTWKCLSQNCTLIENTGFGALSNLKDLRPSKIFRQTHNLQHLYIVIVITTAYLAHNKYTFMINILLK